MKKAISYLRYSHDGQSQHSIERQKVLIENWTGHNKIEITDSFIDEGYSARTFDRPDMKSLMAFVKKNHRTIDYLVVAELTRFSREAGDAINMVKDIQKAYGICIVSASRGTVYDVYDSNSFFMMGLEFLLGNSENIKRTNDINGGIYAAKKEGRWIQGGRAPFGFKKVGEGKERHLEVVEFEANIIRFIFSSYLQGMPPYLIEREAKAKGLPLTKNGVIQQMLKNPLYMGYQMVKEWKHNPGGLIKLKGFDPIIEEEHWHRVQSMLGVKRQRVVVNDEFPLRGAVKCFCGSGLTAANSRNKVGKYFGYYKCQKPGHVNTNANKAHDMIREIFHIMSIPNRLADEIRKRTAIELKEANSHNHELIEKHKTTIAEIDKKLNSLEEKFIADEIGSDSYKKWHGSLSLERQRIHAVLGGLFKEEDYLAAVLDKNLSLLTDMGSVWEKANASHKKALVELVFDNKLYFKNGTYRTPFILPPFDHSVLILREKGLLWVDDFDYENLSSPFTWRLRDTNRTLADLVSMIAAA